MEGQLPEDWKYNMQARTELLRLNTRIMKVFCKIRKCSTFKG